MGAPDLYQLRTRRRRRDGGKSDAATRLVEPLEGRALFATGPLPLGDEFRVNTATAGSQELFAEAPHAVASSAGGDFVVTWSSSGQDGGAWGVYGQRYAAGGGPLGGEFRINQNTANSQWYPTVAADDAGNFVVTWTDESQDGSQSGVYARRYAADGAALGGEFRVNQTIAGDQRHSTVAVDSDGDFVIVWSGYGQLDGNLWDVYAQRYSAAGVKRGGEFRINTTAAGNQQHASVATAADGSFVVAWTSDGQDGSGSGVYAQRYSAAGAKEGSEFRVNETTDGNQQYGRIATADGGDFVVAWASTGQNGTARDVYARRYTAAGAPKGGEFRVNETTAGEQFAPTVAADADGDFLVTWTTALQDGDAFGVYGRAFDPTGAPRGGEFRVNTTTARNQVYSAVAFDADGDAVVVWESEAQDGGFFGVYGQRFAAPDVTPPSADILDVSPDPRPAPVSDLTIVFAEPVTGFEASDLVLTRDGSPNLLNAAQSLTTSDGRTFALGSLSSLTAVPGHYVLSLAAADSGITDAAGNAIAGDATEEWTVTAVPAVVGRYVFYNHSAYDGFDAKPGAADDGAIASDKVALLPGQAATFANYTGFALGINGVMVDMVGLTGALGTGDFSFATGSPDAATWTDAPVPSLSVRPGAGVGGADRVTFTWPDNLLRARWLRVTVHANPKTGLAAPDVFYFGNLPGETGNSPLSAVVTIADYALTRRAAAAAAGGGEAAPAGLLPIDSRLDHNRDGVVNFRDVLVVRAGLFRDGLPLIAAPVHKLHLPAPVAAPARASAAVLAEDAEYSLSVLLDEPAPTDGQHPL